MDVLIATDGTLDPNQVVEFATALAGDGGTITVLTVVEINRNLLRDLRALFGERTVDTTHQDAEYVGLQPDAGSGVGTDWPGDAEMLARYLEDQMTLRTADLVGALEAAGATTTAVVREGEAASAIVAAAEELGSDVVCIGSTGQGLFEGLLGSTGTKLARRSPVPVLIIR